ncbi:hypothetical protein D9599_22515 [Roseomonas sp. KE2513]|uniref:hypothetical protein n=1 Tax=Roseomonas sp. KE2513 TaxID=2479202 RepID=UPI0018DFC71E|nr:hypothetical protein [Roseomonas sp. KE2513]MBI0538341.1 hypothetical protein [Roseomonas sp. KE2513]
MHLPSPLTDPPPSLHSGDATVVRDLLLRHLGNWQVASDGEPLTGRATRLLGAAAAVLTWMRDREVLRLDAAAVRLALQLRSVATLANRRAFLLPCWATGWFREQPMPNMPESLVYPLNAYLADLPGYDTALSYEGQQGSEARRQHAMVLFVALPSWSAGSLPS